MVEDVLCDLFVPRLLKPIGKKLPIHPLDEFELTHSVLKLRIDTNVMLETIRGRVLLRDAAMEQIDKEDVFVFAEGGSDISVLNEMERHVLHFVDGQKQVQHIAQEMRDSYVNVACFLNSLIDHGCIRKGSLGSVAAAPAAGEESSILSPGDAPKPEPKDSSSIEEFSVYTGAHRASERTGAYRVLRDRRCLLSFFWLLALRLSVWHWWFLLTFSGRVKSRN